MEETKALVLQIVQLRGLLVLLGGLKTWNGH